MRLFGQLTVTTAAVAVCLALLRPSIGLEPYVPGLGGTDKTIIGSGDLLAGMFTHPNELGLVLALGAPAVLLLRSRAGRYAGLAIVLVAILWSASRTAMVAAAVSLLVLRWATQPRRHRLFAAVVALGAFLTVLTPLTTTDPYAYSKRGQIWTASLEHWQGMKWFGGGPDYYQRQLQAASDIGIYGAHGHNLFVNSLVVGGIIGLATMVLFLVVAYAMSVRAMNPTASAYFAALVFSSWLEVVFDFRNLGVYGYAVWIPLAMVFFGASERHEALVGASPVEFEQPLSSTSALASVRELRRPARSLMEIA